MKIHCWKSQVTTHLLNRHHAIHCLLYMYLKWHVSQMIKNSTLYSKTCLIRHLCNPFPCIICHWFTCPFDHFLCFIYCVNWHLVYSVTTSLPQHVPDQTGFTVQCRISSMTSSFILTAVKPGLGWPLHDLRDCPRLVPNDQVIMLAIWTFLTSPWMFGDTWLWRPMGLLFILAKLSSPNQITFC